MRKNFFFLFSHSQVSAITIWVNNKQQQHECCIINGFVCNFNDECLLCFSNWNTQIHLSSKWGAMQLSLFKATLQKIFSIHSPYKHSIISTLFPPTIAVKFSAFRKSKEHCQSELLSHEVEAEMFVTCLRTESKGKSLTNCPNNSCTHSFYVIQSSLERKREKPNVTYFN